MMRRIPELYPQFHFPLDSASVLVAMGLRGEYRWSVEEYYRMLFVKNLGWDRNLKGK